MNRMKRIAFKSCRGLFHLTEQGNVFPIDVVHQVRSALFPAAAPRDRHLLSPETS